MLPPRDSKEEGGFIMTVQEAKALIRPMLDEQRYHHSMCVAKEAVRLAKRFGADPEKAELAGILHDIVKQIPAEKQLQMMDAFAIILTETERRSRRMVRFTSVSLAAAEPEYCSEKVVSDGAATKKLEEPQALEPLAAVAK